MKSIPTERRITYQLQYRTCQRQACYCHQGVRRHGPYWYAYWRDHTGKVRSAYIGKTLPAASSEGNAASSHLTQERMGTAPPASRPLVSVAMGDEALGDFFATYLRFVGYRAIQTPIERTSPFDWIASGREVQIILADVDLFLDRSPHEIGGEMVQRWIATHGKVTAWIWLSRRVPALSSTSSSLLVRSFGLRDTLRVPVQLIGMPFHLRTLGPVLHALSSEQNMGEGSQQASFFEEVRGSDERHHEGKGHVGD